MTVTTITLNPCIDKSFSVPRVVPERKLLAEGLREDPGGGGINVARVATRLGGDAEALWSRGGDTGTRLANLLDAEHVRHTPVPTEGSTRENLMIRDAASGELYRFGMPGATLEKEGKARWFEQIERLPPSARYVVVSGSLPGSTPCDWYEELLRAIPRTARVIVDCKKEALRRALKVGVFLIKPNVHELEELAEREMRGDEDIERTARVLIEGGGTEHVIVSLGRGGAFLVTARRSEHFSAPSVEPRSKVGAGDSMVGGLVSALDRGRSLVEATKLGVAAGAATVMTEGTMLCHREDTQRLLRNVRVHGLS